MKRWLTTSNVLATIAMLVALSGSGVVAQAALKKRTPVFTGTNVRNGTLTGADLKDGTLASTDFSTAASTALKAQVGAPGDTGAPGPIGNKGFKGRKGPDGVDAARAYSYITADDTTTYVSPKSGTLSNPDPAKGDCDFASTLPAFLGLTANCSPFDPVFPHWRYDCENILPVHCLSSDDIGSAGSGATILQSTGDGVIGFTGDENGSFVSLMGPGNIIVTASLTLMHPENSNFLSRIACQPQVRRSNSADQYTNLGVPTIVTGRDVDELVHITVTGGARFEQAGDYDYQVSCQMLDEYTISNESDNWLFISGNATATTTEM